MNTQELAKRAAATQKQTQQQRPTKRARATANLRVQDPETSLCNFFIKNLPRTMQESHKNSGNNKTVVEMELRFGVIGEKLEDATHSPPRRVSYPAGNDETNHLRVLDCPDEHSFYFVSDVGKARWVQSRDTLKKAGWKESKYPPETALDYGNGVRAVLPVADQPNEHTLAKARWERKTRCDMMQWTIPEAHLDVRICASMESPLRPPPLSNIAAAPPNQTSNTRRPNANDFHCQRIKHRWCYTRDHNPWRLDLTKVVTTKKQSAQQQVPSVSVSYELEVELLSNALRYAQALKTIQERNRLFAQWAKQLWRIVRLLNPAYPDHPVHQAAFPLLQTLPTSQVSWALDRCRVLRNYADPSCCRTKPLRILPGSMPVNLTRHHLEAMPYQQYYISEKTDGVRHWLVFSSEGSMAVLVDRDLNCRVVLPRRNHSSKSKKNPSFFGDLAHLIRPGTVLDGEVVWNHPQKGSDPHSDHEQQPKAVFIVFDVLAISNTEIVLKRPFRDRMALLEQAAFARKHQPHTITDGTKNNKKQRSFVWNDDTLAMPLLRKEFYKQIEIDSLLSNVKEENGRGRYYQSGVHNHLTDGFVFHPDSPYVCGTDNGLRKWKYHDTLTIDVKLTHFAEQAIDDPQLLRVTVGKAEDTIDIVLPKSERMRLEADVERTSRTAPIVAEVGFHADLGEWYYVGPSCG